MLGRNVGFIFVIAFISVATQSHAEYRLLKNKRFVDEVQAPGYEPGVTISHINSLTINSIGEVATEVSLDGPGIGIGNHRALAVTFNGQVILPVREGQIVAGLNPPRALYLLGIFTFNGAGQLFFESPIKEPDASWDSTTGLFVAEATGLYAIAVRNGEVSFLGNGVFYSSLSRYIAANDSGEMLFLATIAGTGINTANNSILVTGQAGSPISFARTGEPLTGDSSQVLASINSIQAAFPITNSGKTAFRCNISAANGGPSNIPAVVAGPSNDLKVVAKQLDPAPGIPSVIMSSILSSKVTINSDGYVAFVAGLIGLGVTSLNDSALFGETDAGLRLVAREGDVITTSIGPAEIGSIQNELIDLSGNVFFRANLRGTGVDATNDEAIVRGDGAGLNVIARKGETPPGVESGVFIDRLFGFSINSAGQTVFAAELAGIDVDDSNNRGIWATNPSGELVLIIRNGDAFDIGETACDVELDIVGGTGFRTGTSSVGGGPSGINDGGQIALSPGSFSFHSSAYVAQFIESPDCDCAGDMNSDGAINGLDIHAMMQCLLNTNGVECDCADLSGDGAIDAEDVCRFQFELFAGSSCP